MIRTPVHRPEFGDYIYSDGAGLQRIDPDINRVIAGICRTPGLRLSDADWQRYLPGVDRVPVRP